MNIDVDSFSEDQKKLLAMIVSDFGGPTSAASLLMTIENVLYTLNPVIDLSSVAIGNEQLRDDLEVCMAALQYWKVREIAKA